MGSGRIESFEQLEAWQAARALVRELYRLVRSKPLSSDWDLRSQLCRAAVSVMTNIAEGFERVHKQEKLQLYNVARSSCGEVRSLLYVVSDNYPGSAAHAGQLREKAKELGRLITGLMRSTESRKARPRH